MSPVRGYGTAEKGSRATMPILIGGHALLLSPVLRSAK